jgi:hypothetical protein
MCVEQLTSTVVVHWEMKTIILFLKHERHSRNVSVWCALMNVFEKPTVTGDTSDYGGEKKHCITSLWEQFSS